MRFCEVVMMSEDVITRIVAVIISFDMRHDKGDVQCEAFPYNLLSMKSKGADFA